MLPRFVDGAPAFLNMDAFRRRVRLVAEPFLLDANARARAAGATAYCHVVGLGLGVWALHQRRQAPAMVDVYGALLHELGPALAHVGDVDFSWFPPVERSPRTPEH